MGLTLSMPLWNSSTKLANKGCVSSERLLQYVVALSPIELNERVAVSVSHLFPTTRNARQRRILRPLLVRLITALRFTFWMLTCVK